MTELQTKVLERAKREMEKKAWFRGVCMDSFKWMDDHKINEMGFKAAVDELVYDTMSWDAW